MEAQNDNKHSRPKTSLCNNRRRHKTRRRAKKGAQKQKEKERLNNAEKQKHMNKDDVVLSGDEDNKLQLDNLSSFEVYVRQYKGGRDYDVLFFLITQEASPRFPSLLDECPSHSTIIPDFFRSADRGDDNEEKADVEDGIHGEVVHPETDDDASSLDADNFSNYNHPYHDDKPHQNPMKKIKIVKAIIDDEEYVQYDFTMDDTIDGMHDSPFEPDDEESSGDVSGYVQAHLQRMKRGNKQWIPPPQVEVGDVKEIELTEDDISFLQLTELSSDRIRACNW